MSEETKQVEKFHHPKGLWLACMGMCSSSYLKYAVSGIALFFYTYSVQKGGLGLDRSYAGLLISITVSVGALLPIIGSIITEMFLGIQKALLLSFFFQGVAYLFFYLFTPNVPLVIAGVIINVLASAFLNNNLSAIVGLLYSNKDHSRKDAAYGIFYMAVNIGSFFGPIIGGLITDQWMAVKDPAGGIITYGYKYAYLMVSIGMFITFALFYLLAPKWLKEVGKYPEGKKPKEAKSEKNVVNQRLTDTDKKRIVAMFIIFIFATMYWAAYFQTSYVINDMASKYVNLKIGSFDMPVVWLISFNGILCIILAPVFGSLWVKLAHMKIDPPVSLKMAVGMIITGAAFFIILGGYNTLGGVLDESVKMDLWIMLLAYTILTIGELLVSPVGMALFSKLTPERFSSLGMSGWYLCYFFSGLASGALVAVTDKWGYDKILWVLGGSLVVAGLFMFALKPFLEKLIAMDKLGKETEVAE
jgi:proton/peptide symporter family protein